MSEANFTAEERAALNRETKGSSRSDAASRKAARAEARKLAKEKEKARLEMQAERVKALEAAKALEIAQAELSAATPPWEESADVSADALAAAREKAKSLGKPRLTVFFKDKGSSPATRTFDSVAQLGAVLSVLSKVATGTITGLLDCDDGRVVMVNDFSHVEIGGATAHLIQSSGSRGGRKLIVMG